MQIGKAVEAADLDLIQLFEGRIVAEVIRPNFRREHRAALGLPIEMRDVPKSRRHDFLFTALEIKAKNRLLPVTTGRAYIAVRADRRVQLFVRAEPKRTPGVTIRIGQRREHDRRVPEFAARHIESDTQNRPGACDLEWAVDELDAVWEMKVIEQDARLGSTPRGSLGDQQDPFTARPGEEIVDGSGERQDVRGNLAAPKSEKDNSKDDTLQSGDDVSGELASHGLHSGIEHVY